MFLPLARPLRNEEVKNNRRLRWCSASCQRTRTTNALTSQDVSALLFWTPQPTKSITFAGGGSITFTYDAAGIKLKKQVSGAKEGENYTLYYIGGIEYRDDKIESIHHAEGRVTFNEDDEAQYEYFLKDHPPEAGQALGNARVTIADKDGDGYIEPFNINPNQPNPSGGNDGAPLDLTNTEVLQETHYYPFGMEMEGEWEDIVHGAENK